MGAAAATRPDDQAAPLTGNAHILLQYEPVLAVRPAGASHLNFVRMRQMDFFRQDAQLQINPEHYEPSFIAKDVDELSRNAGTRQALRQYKILEDGPEEQEESHIDPKATKTKEQQDAGSKKEKDMYSDKMNRSEERKSGDNKSRDSTERPGVNSQSKDFDRGSSDKSREMLRAQKQDAGDKDGRSSA